MKGKKLWWIIALLSVMIVAVSVIVLLRPFEAYGGRPVFKGEGSAFRYGGRVRGDGIIEVGVSYDVNDLKAVQAYKEANDTRARALIARGEARRIWVQVTFTRPLPADEVRALVKETGFEVEHWLMVGRASNGERIIHGQLGTISDNVSEKVYDPVWNVEMTYTGIILLQGTVDTTEEGLGRWLADERVYLIDTTAVEVQELIAQRHPDIAAVGKEIEVSMDSPFWNFNW